MSSNDRNDRRRQAPAAASATSPAAGAAPSQQAANPNTRNNEYFIPRDGIDREVITADICRFLGNDALVRPGTYESNGQSIQGYYITAYRNLTTAMIDTLKEDSAKWEAERRKGNTGGAQLRYADSDTREFRNPNNPPQGGQYSSYRDYQDPHYAQPGPSYSGYAAPHPQHYSGGGYGAPHSGYPNRMDYGSAPDHGPQYGGAYGHPSDGPYMSPVNSRNAGYAAHPGTAPAPYPSDHPGMSSGYGNQTQPGYQPPNPYYGGGQPHPAAAAQPVATGYDGNAPQTRDVFPGRGGYQGDIISASSASSPRLNANSDFVASPAGYTPGTGQQQYDEAQAQAPAPVPHSRSSGSPKTSSSSAQAQTGNSGTNPANRRDRERDRDPERHSTTDRERRSHYGSGGSRR